MTGDSNDKKGALAGIYPLSVVVVVRSHKATMAVSLSLGQRRRVAVWPMLPNGWLLVGVTIAVPQG